MNSGRDFIFAALFFLLALVSASLTNNAPLYPNEGFIQMILGIVIATQVVLFMAKWSQPKPVNWLTADVLFSAAFSVIHFSYFFYWLTGALEGQTELWYLRNASVPDRVCVGLAMFATTLNAFLFGYYLIPTRRYDPLINQIPIPPQISMAWGKLGRFMIRMSFLGFLAFVMIVGPAKFFGVYSGTNNISFIGNIFFQLGQVFGIAGMTIAFASRERFVRYARRRRWGISYLDLFLIATSIVAIGLHGDRSTLLYIFVAFIVARSEFHRPYRVSTLAVTGVVLVFFLGFIIAFRSGNAERFDFDPMTNINNALVNLGTSSVCGFVAIDHVPDKQDYSMGQMQLRQLAGILPFGRRIFGIGDTTENSSSMLLTELIQGRVGKGVAGTGTSVFADFYFDFGFWGTVVLILMTGMLAKTVQNRARLSTSMLLQVFNVSLISFLAICSRYSLVGGLIRTVLYSGLYTWFFATMLGVPLVYRFRPVRRPHPGMVQPQRRFGPGQPPR